VIVVGHQLVLVEDPLVAADGLGEKVEKLQAIAVAEEDVLAVVAAVVQVPGGACEVEPKRSCHVTEATSAQAAAPRRLPKAGA
jgi:hypothetical protein